MKEKMPNKCFLFDVDGTLTEPRQRMTEEFALFFSDWMEGKDVFLVSGSDFPKIKEQVPASIIDKCKGVFTCMGNELWEEGKNIYRNSLSLPKEVKTWLDEKVENSRFEKATRKPPHFEFRGGMVNFSVVGRGASNALRQYYYEWDEGKKERENIAEEFNKEFNKKYNLEALVGGQISLDIQEIGKDKSQIIDHLDYEEYVFFGDKCDEGGNDYSLYERATEKWKVVNYEHTFRILETNHAFKMLKTNVKEK